MSLSAFIFAMELARSSLALDQMYRTWIQSEGVAGAESLELMMFDDAPRDNVGRHVLRMDRVPAVFLIAT
jgi:hypothetical protein